MKHCLAAVAVSFTVGIAGCDDRAITEKAGAREAFQATVPARPGDAAGPRQTVDGTAIPGAPEFIALFPGAEIIMPDGAAPTHQVTFTTDAPPDTVIAFYKERAESSGLRPTAAMNQGLARAYGASRSQPGTSLQVVASPTDEGLTSVQLNWTGPGQ